jgi:hypothetical protein
LRDQILFRCERACHGGHSSGVAWTHLIVELRHCRANLDVDAELARAPLRGKLAKQLGNFWSID